MNGLDKDSRLRAEREAAARKAALARRAASLNVPFPYRVRPPSLDFFDFPAEPQGTESPPL